MSVYSIKDLESLSDIKSHTIRIWEKRYGLLEPERTATNIRIYDDAHLKKILNISMLIRAGHKISKLAEFSNDDLDLAINSLFEKDNSGVSKDEDAVNKIILAALSFDEDLYNQVFDNSLNKLGLAKLITLVLYPALSKIGVMWLGDQMFPAQEHFISKLTIRKLYAAIDKVQKSKNKLIKPKEKWLLFLPETESHEIGLILAHLLLLENNCEVIYLGDRVPLSNLTSPLKITKPTKVLYFINTKPKKISVEVMINRIEKSCRNQEVFVSGPSAILDNISMGKTIQLLSPNHLIELIS